MSLALPASRPNTPSGEDLIELRLFVDGVWSVLSEGNVIGYVEKAGWGYTALEGANFTWAGLVGEFAHAADAIAAIVSRRAIAG